MTNKTNKEKLSWSNQDAIKKLGELSKESKLEKALNLIAELRSIEGYVDREQRNSYLQSEPGIVYEGTNGKYDKNVPLWKGFENKKRIAIGGGTGSYIPDVRLTSEVIRGIKKEPVVFSKDKKFYVAVFVEDRSACHDGYDASVNFIYFGKATMLEGAKDEREI